MTRDYQGFVVRIIVTPLGSCDSTKAEVMGLLMGHRELQKTRDSNALVEGDFAVVISWGSGQSFGSWKYVHFIHEIRDLMASLAVTLSHILWSPNALVDKLANWGVGLESDFVSSANVLPDDL